MFRKLSLLLLVAVAALLLTATAVQAQAQTRTRWVYSGGCFENVGGGRWTEFAPNGRYSFQLVRRTPVFVQIHNASRQRSIRLYGNHCNVREGSGTSWRRLHAGRWQSQPRQSVPVGNNRP